MEKETDEDILQLKHSISCTYDTIIGLEKSIAVMEEEIRVIHRKKLQEVNLPINQKLRKPFNLNCFANSEKPEKVNQVNQNTNKQ